MQKAEQAKEIKEFLKPFFIQSQKEILKDLEDSGKDPLETKLKYKVIKELESYIDSLIEKGKLYQFKLDKAIQAIEAQKKNGGR